MAKPMKTLVLQYPMTSFLKALYLFYFVINYFYQVLSMMKYAKTLTDDNVFHPLLKCLLGRVVFMATGQCKMNLCQIVTEFILPDLWTVTKLPGNYESPEVFTVLVNFLVYKLLS